MLKTDLRLSTITEKAVRPARIALICDLLEENWPSMDLIADMLFQHLQRDHEADLEVTRVCPPMRRRFGRFPKVGVASASHNVFHNIDRLANRFFDYPRHLRELRSNVDLFHILDHSYSQLVHCLPTERTVVTCHDLDTFRCLLDPAREKRPAWFRAMTARILKGFTQAAHVITGSAIVRDEIVSYGLLPTQRITVIPNGVHPSCSPNRDSVADDELARLLPPDPGSPFWLLNVGSTIQRKRLDILLRVLAAVRQDLPGVRLMRVGGPLTPEHLRLAEELNIQDAIVELGSITREMLGAAYRRADLLVHTAEAEGFGLPLIESMACGCRVVASDIAVLREISGPGAIYCSLDDIQGWRATVVRMLRDRFERCGAFEHDRKQALAHAARFSWTETARRTADIYQQVLHSATHQ
ncbi:MAG TPA: glycosyltransferase family 1 protein [Bryobacteraceae bacterium]|nr:glycosyltransferase family 1 protein [Bryobacteraceae bacterium]